MAQVLTDLHLELEMERVLRGLGADTEIARPRDSVLALVREMLVEARGLLAPAVIYALYPLREVRGQQIILSNDRALQAGQCAETLSSAQEIVLLVGTIGPRLEKRASQYFDTGYPAKGAILDGIGSTAVEELIEQACRVVEELPEANGLQASAPCCPGHNDWPLEVQNQIFEVLPTGRVGVTLGPTCMMLPRKSLSMILGLGREFRSAGKSACEICCVRATCRYSQLRLRDAVAGARCPQRVQPSRQGVCPASKPGVRERTARGSVFESLQPADCAAHIQLPFR